MSVDYADYQTPQAHANAIAATGAPPLVLHNGLMVPGGVLAANAVVVGGPAFPTQPSWFAYILLQLSAAATAPFVGIELDWLDSGGGVTIWTDRFKLPAGGTFGNQFTGRGPVNGNELKLTVRNYDTVVSLSWSAAFYQGSQTILRPDFRLLAPGFSVVTGFTAPDFTDPQAGIIGTRSISLLTGGVDNILVPPFYGRARFNLHTASGMTDCNVQITQQNPDIPVASTTLIYENNSDATGDINDDLILPPAPVIVRIKNNNASTRIVNWSITAADY